MSGPTNHCLMRCAHRKLPVEHPSQIAAVPRFATGLEFASRDRFAGRAGRDSLWLGRAGLDCFPSGLDRTEPYCAGHRLDGVLWFSHIRSAGQPVIDHERRRFHRVPEPLLPGLAFRTDRVSAVVLSAQLSCLAAAVRAARLCCVICCVSNPDRRISGNGADQGREQPRALALCRRRRPDFTRSGYQHRRRPMRFFGRRSPHRGRAVTAIATDPGRDFAGAPLVQAAVLLARAGRARSIAPIQGPARRGRFCSRIGGPQRDHLRA